MSDTAEAFVPLSRTLRSAQISASELVAVQHHIVTVQQGNLSVDFGSEMQIVRIEEGDGGTIHVFVREDYLSPECRIILNPDHKVTITL